MKKLKKINIMALILAMVVVLIPCVSAMAADTNTSKETAYTIKTNRTYSYNGIEKSYWNEEDRWFKTTLTEDGYFFFKYEKSVYDGASSIDYKVYVDNVLIDSGSGSNSTNPSFSSRTFGYPAGTVIYVQLSGNYGPSNFKVSLINEADANWEQESNDSIDTADEVPVNTSYYGIVSKSDKYDYSYTTIEKSGYIQVEFGRKDFYESGDSVDDYKAEIIVDNNVIYTLEMKETNMEGVKSYPLPFEKGNKVYVRVVNKGTYSADLPYEIRFVETVSDEWESEYNDSLETADVLVDGKYVLGNFTGKDEVDWYKYNVKSNGTIEIKGGDKSVDGSARAGFEVFVDNESVFKDERDNEVYNTLEEIEVTKGQVICVKVEEDSWYDTDAPYKLSITLKKSTKANVSYTTHVQSFGWQSNVSNGVMAGTSGKAKRLESIKISTDVEGLGIQYTTHCQSYGWLPWSADGQENGTTGEAKRLEAIKIQLTGVNKDKYDVYYRVHAQSYGWLGWAKNGEASGTAGYGKRLEGIQVVIVPKGSTAPGTTYAGVTGSASNKAYYAKDGKTPTVAGADTLNVKYRTHVQSYGWQAFKYNGAMSGTSGQAKRLEGIEISLTNTVNGGIQYRTHVQTYGWETDWRSNGTMSGTSGQAKRLEAIQIQLTGEVAKQYDVYYRVHAQSYGWLGWAKNGESAGTAGYAKRLEGIQIVLVKKGGKAPTSYEGITSQYNKAYIEK